MSDLPKLGDRSSAIELISNTLLRLGFIATPSDIFDDNLTQGIKAFQQERGLTATGVINEITARSLEEARFKLGDRVLVFNAAALMRGDDVSNLQDRSITITLLAKAGDLTECLTLSLRADGAPPETVLTNRINEINVAGPHLPSERMPTDF